MLFIVLAWLAQIESPGQVGVYDKMKSIYVLFEPSQFCLEEDRTSIYEKHFSDKSALKGC